MKLHQLVERAKSVPNPLGKMPSNIYDIMNSLDSIENNFHAAFHKNTNITDFPTKIKQTRSSIDQLGKVVDMDISKLITMEPDVDPDHIKKLNSQPGDGDPATVYKYNNEYYINDGNHRVAAAHVANKTNIKVNLIDIVDVINKTEQMSENQ